jgi:hypothetical protein
MERQSCWGFGTVSSLTSLVVHKIKREETLEMWPSKGLEFINIQE